MTTAPYKARGGLALCFAVSAEERFAGLSVKLEAALHASGFDSFSFDAKDILGDARRALRSRATPPSSVVVVYNGHGGWHNGAHILWAEEPRPAVRVAELEQLVNLAVPAGTPKVFFLDCCSSDYNGGDAPPAWKVNATSTSVHDVAMLHAASPGHYSYYYDDFSLGTCVADVIGGAPDGVSLTDIKYAVGPPMRSRHDDVEPFLDDRLSRPFVFRKAASAGRRLPVGDGFRDDPPDAASPRFALRCVAFGNLLSPQPGGHGVTAVPSARGASEWLELVHVGDDRVALKTAHGGFLSPQPDGSIRAVDAARGDWEKFAVEHHAGSFSLKSAHGRFLAVAGAADGARVSWDAADGGSAACRFHAELEAGSYAFTSQSHDNALSPRADGSVATAARGAGEPILVAPAGDGSVTLKSRHGFLSRSADGRARVVAAARDASKVFVAPNACGGLTGFAVASHDGFFLCNEGARTVWDRKGAREYETFDVVRV